MTSPITDLWPDVTRPNPEWLDRAKCKDTAMTPGRDPFDPGRGYDKKKVAAKLCAGCPVIAACAQDALHYKDHGVIRAATFIPNHAGGVPLLPGVIARLERIAGIDSAEVAA